MFALYLACWYERYIREHVLDGRNSWTCLKLLLQLPAMSTTESFVCGNSSEEMQWCCQLLIWVFGCLWQLLGMDSAGATGTLFARQKWNGWCGVFSDPCDFWVVMSLLVILRISPGRAKELQFSPILTVQFKFNSLIEFFYWSTSHTGNHGAGVYRKPSILCVSVFIGEIVANLAGWAVKQLSVLYLVLHLTAVMAQLLAII